MVAPAAIAGVGMGATAGGSILGALGAVFSGQSQSAMYTYQAGVAGINKIIQTQNAEYERVAGERRAQESGMRTAARVGQIEAAQGASGLDVNRGSAAEVRQSQGDIGRFDQAMIRSNAAHRAYGYEMQAWEAGEQQKVLGVAASNAKTAGVLGGISSILGGASSVAGQWLKAGPVFGMADNSGSSSQRELWGGRDY